MYTHPPKDSEINLPVKFAENEKRNVIRVTPRFNLGSLVALILWMKQEGGSQRRADETGRQGDGRDKRGCE